MNQLRLEGRHVSSDGLRDELVLDFPTNGDVVVTCRSYSSRGKLKISAVIVPKDKWQALVTFLKG